MRSWTPRPAPGFPEHLILFDGVCLLCSRWVREVIARDPDRRFSFVSVQSSYGRALSAKVGVDAEAPETNAVIEDGRALFKSDAVIAVLSRLKGFGWVRAFSALPRPVRDFAYDRIAKNRYAVFGKSDACFMPAPEDRARFLDGASPPHVA